MSLDLNVQKYIVGYSAAISTLSPSLTSIQLLRVCKKPIVTSELAKISMRIFPHQTFLKCAQMNLATPVKEYANPWLAFGVVGVLQGGVYGQCTTYVSRMLNLAKKTPSLKDLLRGSAFAGARDTVSQGVPFAYAAEVQARVVDPAYCAFAGAEAADDDALWAARRGAAVAATSVAATVASQFPHNCQIRMQADPTLGYASVVRTLMAEHGPKVFYMGASARIALLLVVNSLNELVLKRAWAARDEGE